MDSFSRILGPTKHTALPNVNSRKRNFFSTLVPGSGSFQPPDLAGMGYVLGLGFCVVFTIIVSLIVTVILITTLTVILP